MTTAKCVRYDTLSPNEGKRRLDWATSNMDETFLQMLSRKDVKALKMEIEFDVECDIPFSPKLAGYIHVKNFKDK